MTDEAKKRINEILAEIEEHQMAINDLEWEVEKINLKENADFTSKYICYYNGLGESDEYVFMRVEKQIYRKNGTVIHLQGPAIILDNDPLNKEDGYPDVYHGEYDQYYSFDINEVIVMGRSFAHIREISESEFAKVLNFWHKTMKNALI